jgi:hypothetical protein
MGAINLLLFEEVPLGEVTWQNRFGSKPGSGIGTGKYLVIEGLWVQFILWWELWNWNFVHTLGGFTQQISVRSDSSLGHQGAKTKNITNKPGGDRVHVCVMGLKWGHTGVVHVASLP